jgi:serine/threonine protein kinase
VPAGAPGDVPAGLRVTVTPLDAADPAFLDGYRLRGRIGRGGQGTVYLASDPNGSLVAVKALRADRLTDPQARERLAGEVAAARRVPAFCTARLLDARLAGPTPYLVTEFVDGPSLQQRVRSAGPLDRDSLDRLAVGTLTALITIHNAGLVHHDVKPGNVLLGPDGARLVDFGIAAVAGTASAGASSADGVLATPAFMAPELLSPGRATPAADLFAWACTVTFAATGHSPFHAPDTDALLHRLEHDEPDLTGVPTPLRPVLRTCLAKDPTLRPDARQALTRLLADVQPPAEPAPPTGENAAEPAPDKDAATARTKPSTGAGPVDGAVPAWGTPSIPPIPPSPPIPARPSRPSMPRPTASRTRRRRGPARTRPRRAGHRVLWLIGALVVGRMLVGNQDALTDQGGASQVTVHGTDVLTGSPFGVDHDIAAVSSDGEVTWYRISDGDLEEDHSTRLQDAVRISLATLSDTGLLAAATGDRQVRLWSPTDGRTRGGPIPVGGTVTGLGFGRSSGAGTRLAVLGDLDGDGRQQVRVWSVATEGWVGEPVPAQSASLSTDGTLLAVRTAEGDDAVQLIPVGGSAPATRITGCPGSLPPVVTLGRVTCNDHGQVRISTVDGQSVESLRLSPSATAQTVLPDTGQVAYAGPEGVDLVDVQQGTVRRYRPPLTPAVATGVGYQAPDTLVLSSTDALYLDRTQPEE